METKKEKELASKDQIMMSTFMIVAFFIITVFVVISQNQQMEQDIYNNSQINNTDYESIRHYSNATKPEILNTEQQNIVSQYIETNISELSEEEAVLGGEFYVNSIDFIDANNLIVEYEDGHILLMALVNFNYTENNEVEIINFQLLEEPVK